ncbi:hypothetical protein E3N88_42162 [Mikania micrantha]|uniref:RNase III domain-containing protein n=1 Tax=Mikania micrantha TaxID=192012 RepID=A0A5N6LII7_9ASTR|nr:hypothetical protein E3N88_42162 [Mikania micrantha]
MELSSPNSNIYHHPRDLSFASSISPFPIKTRFQNLNFRKPKSLNLKISALESQEKQELPKNSPQRLLKELSQRRKFVSPNKRVPPKRFILKPPLDDAKLAQRFLNSPQLSLKQFPLLSSCLPSMKFNNADKTWIDEYLLEAKQALGYPLEPSENYGDDNPAKQFDTLLYLAFGHPHCERTNARHVRSGHSRLGFLGQYVLELALAEFFLQRYPRESPGPMRERVYALIGKRYLPKWIKAASLHNLIFQYDDMDKLIRKEREPPVKSVFWALFGAIYLCFGMPEVYRVLFEVFGMDPEDEECQPKLRRQLEDVDYVSAEFEGRKLSWQEVAAYKASFDKLHDYIIYSYDNSRKYKIHMSTTAGSGTQQPPRSNKPFMGFPTPSMASLMLDGSCLRFLTLSKPNLKPYDLRLS